MHTTSEAAATDTLPFTVRALKASDLPQPMEIEMEAFPTLFPPTSFRRELKNSRASYLVAFRRNNGAGAATSAKGPTLTATVVRKARNILGGGISAHVDGGQDFVAGFLGTWHMVDEAHIVSVGVRKAYRGQGIGELLLISAIEQAVLRHASLVTLEVRPTNHVAINLYLKYGFKERGVRKAYYADNREDAIIMSTDPIHFPPYPDLLRELEIEHRRRWGNGEWQPL